MKIFLCSLMVVLAVFAVYAAAADVSGKWSGTFTQMRSDGTSEDGAAFMVLKQTGSEITGTGGPDEGEQWPIQKGKIEGNKITGQVQDPNGATFTLSLMLEGDHIKGDVTVTSPEGETMKAKLDMTRVK